MMFYLHLGKNESVRKSDVVGIFDIETATMSRDTKNFLKTAQDNMKVVNLTADLPRSFVLTDTDWTETVYLTALSAESIGKRRGAI